MAARPACTEVSRTLRSGLDTSAILKNPAEAILKTHGWQYDPGNNRIASKTDNGGLIRSRHNKLNQLLTNGIGPIRFAGTIDEPGTVTVNGQEARMRYQTLFEAYLELPPGTHEIEVEATDFSENTSTQSFEVEVADEPATQLEYDLNGNFTKRTNASGITTYESDALDRLITIIYPDTSRSEFTYDGLSRRTRIIEKNSSGTVISDKRHLWDDIQIVEERATDGSIVTKRFYPQGVELVTGLAAGNYTYRTDHLGSIREVVDSTGVLTARFDYSEWGEVSPAPIGFDIEQNPVYGSFDLDFCFTGHYAHQPSGLHLAPFRGYDASLGRWLPADPIGEAGGLNLYGYVGNDPLNFIDPDGRHPVLAIPIIIGLFATTENAHAPANAEDQNVPPPGIALAAQAMFPPGVGCAKNGMQGLNAARNVAKAAAGADEAVKWIFGKNKGVEKPIRQMQQRGWTPAQVTEALKSGQRFPAENLVNKGNPAARCVHPQSGQSVVQDTVTKEIIHFGGPGFKY